jgi:hypothetical protein
MHIQLDIKALIVINLIVLPFLTVGQSAAKDMAYLRYEGTINNEINIVANIIKIPPKLSGNYQYKYLDDNAEMHYGKTIELKGDIDGNNFARLKEFGRNEYAFEGSIKGKSYTGNWNAGKDKTLPFELNEYYPNGSIGFDVFYLHSEGELVKGDPSTPVAEIELTLLFPDGKYVQAGIGDSVKKIISTSYFGSGFEVTTADSMLLAFEEEYLENYARQNENWHKTQGASFNWEKVISMTVIYNATYMLCLEYLKYAYSGGAHGMTNISYDIIYLDNGQLLTYSDIFIEGSDQQLSEILTSQLRNDYGIPDDVKLSEAGFFVEEVEPNRNIYVTGNGVGFLYNSYEIAPYSQGATNIFLEFKQIRDLVKMGTPVFEMSRQF